jgi:hypothetical protein
MGFQPGGLSWAWELVQSRMEILRGSGWCGESSADKNRGDALRVWCPPEPSQSCWSVLDAGLVPVTTRGHWGRLVKQRMAPGRPCMSAWETDGTPCRLECFRCSSQWRKSNDDSMRDFSRWNLWSPDCDSFAGDWACPLWRRSNAVSMSGFRMITGRCLADLILVA